MKLISTFFNTITITSGVLAAKGGTGSKGKSDSSTTTPTPTPASGGGLATVSVPTAALAGPVSLIPGTSLPATFGKGTPLPPGATPINFPNAPPLPSLSGFNVAVYPPLDIVPPVDSPQVKQWLSQIDMTKVPKIAPSNKGACPAGVNTVAAQDTACWWTCSKCVAPDDIVTCPEKNTWGFTLDDGPSPAAQVLDPVLAANNITATLFVVGSRVISYPQLLQNEYISGHQIAIHTWSHSALTSLTSEQIVAEFGWTRKAIKDVLGVSPLYYRGPYGDVDNRVRAIARQMNLTNVIWTSVGQSDFNTQDWQVGPSVTEQTVVDNFQRILSLVPGLPGGFIVLEHNLLPEEVNVAEKYILPMALGSTNPKLKIQDILTCHSLSPAAGYAETNTGNTTSSGSSSGGSSSSGSNSSPKGSNGTNSSSSSGTPSQFVVPIGAIFGLLFTIPFVL